MLKRSREKGVRERTWLHTEAEWQKARSVGEFHKQSMDINVLAQSCREMLMPQFPRMQQNRLATNRCHSWTTRDFPRDFMLRLQSIHKLLPADLACLEFFQSIDDTFETGSSHVTGVWPDLLLCDEYLRYLSKMKSLFKIIHMSRMILSQELIILAQEGIADGEHHLNSRDWRYER